MILTNRNSETYPSYACGKAIIVGEHAAIHGATAIAIPLKELQVQLTLSTKENKNLNSFADNVGEKIQDENFSFNLLKLLKKAFEIIGQSYTPLPIKIRSNILIGSGLGSSAALCVSLIRFLSDYYQKKFSPPEIAKLANELEKLFHGNPSGLDTAVISFEKPVIYQKGTPPSFIKVNSLPLHNKKFRWPFVIIDTGERTPTYLMVEKTKKYFTGDSGKKRIAQTNQMACDIIDSFNENNLEKMAKTINTAAHSLEEIGIVTEHAKEISSQARNLGIPAIKVTGSGGGGCLLALLDPLKSKEQHENLTQLLGKNKVFQIYL